MELFNTVALATGLCGVAAISLVVENSLGCSVLINVLHKNPGLQIGSSHVKGWMLLPSWSLTETYLSVASLLLHLPPILADMRPPSFFT